jgi:hypothetical protein
VTEQAERVEQLVGELKATGTLWPETVADLERFVGEARAGTLWQDDLNYLVALHAKIVLNEDASPPAEAVAMVTDTKFQEIKRRFDLRYHPETGTENDRAIREKVFDAFGAEFEAVERS